jgi:septum site-determining protein MinC
LFECLLKFSVIDRIMTITNTASTTDQPSVVRTTSPEENQVPIDQLSVDSAVASSANVDSVDSAVANSANVSSVDSAVANSANVDSVDSAITNPVSVDGVDSVPTSPENNFISWHVHLKTDDGVIQMLLPTLAETSNNIGWSEIWEQIQQRLTGAKRFWQPLTPVHLYAQDRLLDTRQLQAIANALEEVQLSLELVHTSRRQTAVAAVTSGYSVQQHNPQSSTVIQNALAEPLYLQMTVRSGMEIRHPGTVVIIGDVNPGGEIIAAGDIIVWGHLKGIAHAGSRGNDQCLIMALQMFPTQIRIANFIARSPEQQPVKLEPEVAHVSDGVIRITPSIESKRIPALVDRSSKNKNRFF